ncbi:MAG: sulfatase [Bacteroidota bacterium]
MTLLLLPLLTAFIFDHHAKADVDEDPPNVLFISIDDLRNEVGTLGVDYAQTPHIDSFAEEARLFTHHYVQVPTCGASRAALIRGQRATESRYLSNHAIFDTHDEWSHRSLPTWFKNHGYQTLSLGKITHYPGGLTGDGWAEGPEELPGAWDRIWVPDSPWATPEDMMHGFADGVPRDRGESPAWEAHDGPDTSYPDGWVASDAVDTLEELAETSKPWFFAVGFFKPHLPFAAPQRYFELHDPDDIPAPVDTDRPPNPSSWHASGEMMNNYGQHPGDPNADPDYARQLRHAYAAATSYVDMQVGRVLDQLQALGLDENTIVVIWSDHGFALGEQGIWGKHSLYEVALKSPLIIRYPEMNEPGVASHTIVETIDIFPTLTDLAGLPTPEEVEGNSLRDQLEEPGSVSDQSAFAHWNRGQSTVRTDDWRLIVHRPDDEIEGFELFDFRESEEGVRVNPDEFKSIVEEHLMHIKKVQ